MMQRESDHRTTPSDGNATPIAELNAGVYARDAHRYTSSFELQRPEQALLKGFKGRWSRVDMLDIGVGAGRTAYTFSAITRRYVGIDFVPEMIELSREIVGEDADTLFSVCDARDLSRFYGRRFDFVLFSFNGIDSVDHNDRLAILREIRKVIADDGRFAFSSHSLRALPFGLERPRLSPRHPRYFARQLWSSARISAGRLAANRSVDLPDAYARGWALVRDQAHDFNLITYYVLPEFQVAQLEEAGFSLCTTYDLAGRQVDVRAPGRDPWLYYLGRPC
jgi:SAM-dependent methyltransferase